MYINDLIKINTNQKNLKQLLNKHNNVSMKSSVVTQNIGC